MDGVCHGAVCLTRGAPPGTLSDPSCAGITAYVAYQVVGQHGMGQLSYQQTMTAVFVEGFIFVVLSVTGVRGGIIKFMPKSIAMASSGAAPARCAGRGAAADGVGVWWCVVVVVADWAERHAEVRALSTSLC